MDIFISYRRKTGGDKAYLLQEKLSKMGIECFIDKHSINSEDYMLKIQDNIDSAPNFLMIVTSDYFVKRKDDNVRKEILYAKSKGKNFIGVKFENDTLDDINWDEDEEIREFKTFNFLDYISGNTDVEKAYINTIIRNMKDENGNAFSTKKRIVSNSWYASHGMTDDDRLWIVADHDVCRELDWSLLEKAMNEPIFDGRDKLNVFVYKAYDIETYEKKYSLDPRKKHEKQLSPIYGVTYDFYIEQADVLFGPGNFIPSDFNSSEYTVKMREILDKNGLPGFDIIDLTLIIKDIEKPEKQVRDLARLLNPNGGVIYIRELDDDYVDAYPDENGLIKRMVDYLDLDDGAGNRHTGKKIFTYLKKAGASKVCVSDEVISTANHGVQFRQRICDTYFSYLLPELRELADEKNKGMKNYSKYVEAYNWLKENYEDVENLMCSTEFYFRAGYIAGYGVFRQDEDF